MATRTGGYEIEFIGGPLDGRIDGGLPPLEPFLGVVTMLEERRSRVWRVLGEAVSWFRPRRSLLALYELALVDDRLQYQYLWTQAMTTHQIEQMAGFLPISAPVDEQ